MTEHAFPQAGTLVELTAEGEPHSGVRVIAPQVEGGITLSMPPADTPDAGTTVTLRWPAGPRGRYALRVTVDAVDDSRVQVTPAGPVRIEQQRNFVRGGGGEPVVMCRPDTIDAPGYIRDISEQGVRAYFTDLAVEVGQEFRLRVQLDGEVLEIDATVARVDTMRQTVPEPGPMSVELVARLRPEEFQAQAIRRYVLRQQLLARARGTG